MKRPVRFVIGTLVALCICLCAPAAQAGVAGFNLSGAVGAWWTQPGGDIDNVDLDSDFNFDDKANLALWLKFEHPLPIVPDVRFDYTQVKFDDGRLSSSIDMKIYDLTAYWHIPMLRTVTNDILDVTFGAGARFYDGDVSIHSLTINLADNQVMPFVYVGARVQPIDLFALVAEAKGWSSGDKKTFDGVAKVEVYPFGQWVFVGAGYRYLMLEDTTNDGTWGDTNMNLKPAGFFVELGFDI